jgi:hypothetical protein
MTFQFTPSFTPTRYLLASLAITATLLLATSLAITPTPTVDPNKVATHPIKQEAQHKPIVVADADNISLQSILKPEQQKPAEAYAVGGVDSYTAGKGRSTNNGNLWQVVFALLAVSAGAWAILNTAWFKALAQQKEAQLLQKNGAYLSSPTIANPTRSLTTTSSPLQKATDWVASLLRPETSESIATEPPLANVLQTLPLPSGQFLVMVQIADTIHSLVMGGHHQPLLVGTWQSEAFGISPTNTDPVQTEKWMAQTPPTPTPTARKENLLASNELLTDYEALNATEEALFGQLLQQEKTVL